MNPFYKWSIPAAWAAWAFYWMVSARRVEKNRQREFPLARLLHLGPTLAAFALALVPQFQVGFLSWRLLPDTSGSWGIGAVLTLASLSFAAWARRHLGRYWSGTITLKEGHRLIRTGPYAWVRHPIYTGFLGGVLGTMVTLGELRSFLAFVLLGVIYLLKIRREETWLQREFGEEYLRYQREVNALVPLPRSIQSQL